MTFNVDIHFNLNHEVKVKLNGHGMDILRRNDHPIPAAVDGWCEFQLWDLMATFGPHLSNGCKMPFETTILLPTKFGHL